MEKDNIGPRVARSTKQAHGYSKRVIVFFLLALALLLGAITYQASSNKSGEREQSQAKSKQNYRAPQPLGFAELAAGMRKESFAEVTASMRREARPVSEDLNKSDPERQQTRRIVIERTRPEAPPLPRYYSQKDDAQAANTLRTLKIQALTAKPVVEGFAPQTNTADGPAGRGGAAQVNSAQIADSAALAALARQQGQAPDPNGQTRKEDFLRENGGALTPQGYSANFPIPQPQQFPYELKAGTIIPGLLITGVNSDLPGSVIGQVSENVWDTATGRYVLIPKGTRILGVYDSQVTFGQNRVLLVWNRLVFPNGTTLDIAGSPGVDQAGYSGLSGRVNEHWGEMLKAALLASVFIAGAEIVYDQDQSNSENKSPSDVVAESIAGTILDMGTKLMDRASDIQPTISIRPGKKMGIFVQKDIIFPSPYF